MAQKLRSYLRKRKALPANQEIIRITKRSFKQKRIFTTRIAQKTARVIRILSI